MRKLLKIGLGLFRLLFEWLINLGHLKLHGIGYCICTGVKIWTHDGGLCDLGRKTWLSENCLLECAGGTISLGYNNFFNSNCKIISLEQVKIGDNNLFSPNVVVVDHNHRFDEADELICRQGFNTRPVTIGSDIWIGANVTI